MFGKRMLIRYVQRIQLLPAQTFLYTVADCRKVSGMRLVNTATNRKVLHHACMHELACLQVSVN